MILFAFLAGMSFVVSIAALAFAVAEHYRAQRVEKALLASIEDNRRQLVAMGESEAGLALQVQWAVKELATQDQMIRAVAAASVPPTLTSGKPYIVVPGPRTTQ